MMLSVLQKSLFLLFARPFCFMGIVLVDSSFFLMWGFVLSLINDALQRNVLLFAERNLGASANVVLLLLMLYLAGFCLYVFFQGVAWWLAAVVAGRKRSFRSYFFGFLKVNVLWGFLAVLISLLDLVFGIRSRALAAQDYSLVLAVALWIVAILAFLSYPTLSIRAAFVFPLKRTLPPVVLALLLLFFVKYVPVPLYSVSAFWGNILSFVVAFPALALVRVYAVRVLG